jgi:hypothetical protein
MKTSFGPWTTALDAGSTAQLSALWKRRVALLPGLPLTAPTVSRASRRALVAGALAALFVPTVHFALAPVAQAENPAKLTGSLNAEVKLSGNIKVSTPGPFHVELPAGVSVDILGMSEHPNKGKTWWGPNGGPVPAPYAGEFHGSVSSFLSSTREVAIRWHLPPEKNFTTRWGIIGCSAWAGGTINDVAAAAVALPGGSKTCTYLFGVAAGEWETVAESDGETYSYEGKKDHGFAFTPAYQKDDGVIITISHNVLKKDLRIVALDKHGKFLANGDAHGGGGSAGFVQSTGLFNGLKVADIKGYQLQARDFHWTVVRNVAINRDQQTEPQVIDAGVEMPKKP